MTTTASTAYSVKRKPELPRPLSGLPAPVPKAATQSCALRALLEAKVTRTQLVHQLEDAAAAARDAGERVVGDHHGQARLLGEQLVDVAQQGAAAGEHDAALGDVGA